MLNIALIDSGVEGTARYFGESTTVRLRVERISAQWQPDFSGDDLVIAPNGTNHVALYEARAAIRAHLDRGGVLACFCGFFTPWIPGNVWVHDNSQALRDVRYRIVNDDLGLFEGVTADELAVESHGISGWWACGHIRTAHADSVVLTDNFKRVLVIADARSTPGLIIATASGPLADPQPSAPATGPRRLYRNILKAAQAHLENRHV